MKSSSHNRHHSHTNSGSEFMQAVGRYVDPVLVGAVIALLCLGLIMITSASLVPGEEMGDALYYLKRQTLFIVLGLLAAYIVYQIPLRVWENLRGGLFALSIILLLSVWFPGLGVTSNGARRWIDIGPVVVQVSEPAKILFALYIAAYIVRHGEKVRESLIYVLKPVGLMIVAALLLLAEPDMGAAVVLCLMVLGLLFLAGIKIYQFTLLVLGLGFAFAALAVYSPYRLKRLLGFMDPWSDPYDSGYQLISSLIAIGSGSLTGVGLGGSAQKLSHLPEAHNDFLFAILAEELGLVGVFTVLALYTVVVWRGFMIGANAEAAGQRYASFVAYVISLWVGLQALINIGVNMGVLPTKGLILPFMSTGGSSMVVASVSMALLLRAHRETTGQAVTTIRNKITREYQV